MQNKYSYEYAYKYHKRYFIIIIFVEKKKNVNKLINILLKLKNSIICLLEFTILASRQNKTVSHSTAPIQKPATKSFNYQTLLTCGIF